MLMVFAGFFYLKVRVKVYLNTTENILHEQVT